MTTRSDAPEQPRSERTSALSMLATFVVAAVVPGASVLVIALVVRAVAAGWGPLLGGAALAATWPLVARAWQEIEGRPPRRLWRLPGWVWLGVAGTLLCLLLFA
ncbi:hypothetical protein [Georgenia sp. H159]|uniref:hypothetical protein n=1 Tax=Georgenia sp. H159 TaxID=3076115 RepID=UPI002D7A0AD9|nr:hypothetical protein [Georgenia sp. H159]